MNTSGSRLKALLRECNLTPSDFAAHRKVTPQHINNWFNRGVPLARIDEIAELLCVCSKWLRSGEGPKHPPPAPRITPAEVEVEPPDTSLMAAHKEDDAQLPFYRVKDKQLSVIADRHLRLPACSLERLGVDPARAFCLSMPDTNMAPLLSQGATLAIDRSLTRIVEGELYALLHNGRLRIHTLSRLRGGAIALHSYDNRQFPSESYSPAQAKMQHLEILGWVFWWGQRRTERPA